LNHLALSIQDELDFHNVQALLSTRIVSELEINPLEQRMDLHPLSKLNSLAKLGPSDLLDAQCW
jgi:hypothetical protein